MYLQVHGRRIIKRPLACGISERRWRDQWWLCCLTVTRSTAPVVLFCSSIDLSSCCAGALEHTYVFMYASPISRSRAYIHVDFVQACVCLGLRSRADTCVHVRFDHQHWYGRDKIRLYMRAIYIYIYIYIKACIYSAKLYIPYHFL